jgi:hypothetical protein
MPHTSFKHLVLLIGTNPLPNLVTAEFFLQHNSKLEKIWLLHSAENSHQAGTASQSSNLAGVLFDRWDGKHESLQFPLELISLSDVSDGTTIQNEIDSKIFPHLGEDADFHLNYTGGTKAMATHACLKFQELQKRDQFPFSYLDANNFRLILDGYGVHDAGRDLRKTIQLPFAQLIRLHGFVRPEWERKKNSSKPVYSGDDREAMENWLKTGKGQQSKEGFVLERRTYHHIKQRLQDGFQENCQLLCNWHIEKKGWKQKNNFELDIICVQGYHLTGISCALTANKGTAKLKGFEIIQRCRQIGGDEARAVVVTGLEKRETRQLQQELEYDTGSSKKNILAFGRADLNNKDRYLEKLFDFIFT